MKEQFILGITGPIASGKSTVAKLISTKNSAIIDADKIARDVVKPGTECLKKLKEKFGDIIINKDDTLNRKMLAKIAFEDKELTNNLNEITHPYILSEISKQISLLKKSDKKIIILDIPLLFENNIDKICDAVIAVISPKSLRLKRLIQRDEITENEALKRINMQPDDNYYNKANYIIKTNCSKQELKDRVNNTLNYIYLGE